MKSTTLPPVSTDPCRMLSALADMSEAGPGVTRWPFTHEHRQAVDALTEWMNEAGLNVSLDAAGTLIGRQAGAVTQTSLLIGSHQDSVRGGGAFDGALGVIVGIAAMARLKEAEVALPFAVEVLAFADEEGVRFPTALMGPRALAGTFDSSTLLRTDQHGVSLSQAMRSFGLDVDHIERLKRDPDQLLGYVECHIEQGPVLEAEAKALGVVTAICGIERHSLCFTGRAAHAGTTPMNLRQDALVAAAAWVGAVSQIAQATPDLLATVGQFSVWPGVANAVPGQVTLTLEVRSANDEQRERVARQMVQSAKAVYQGDGVTVESDCTYQQRAVPVSPSLSQRVAMATEQVTGEAATWLPSGATHDASAMADLTDIAMLFVRCRGGVSHHPSEWAEAADIEQAVEVLMQLLRQYALSYPSFSPATTP